VFFCSVYFFEEKVWFSYSSTLRLIIEKRLNRQTSSADKKALVKASLLCIVPDKYVKVVRRICLIPFRMITSIGFVPKENAMGEMNGF